jgi:hypothetical protein
LMRGSASLILGGILVAKPTASGSTDHETDWSGHQGPDDSDNGSCTNRLADHGRPTLRIVAHNATFHC